MIVIPGYHIDAAANTTRQANTSQADMLTAEFTTTLQGSLLHWLHLAAQWPPNSITVNKELNMALRSKKQGKDAPLLAFKGMRLNYWLN